MAWRRPAKRRVRAIRDRLREMYGEPVNEPHGQPIAELSRRSSPSTPTTATATAPSRRCASASPPGRRSATRRSSEVEEAIRPGGLGKQKAPRIQAILERLGEPPDLDWTEDGAARGVARVPARPARRRPQNRRLRPDLHLGHPRDPGRRPHPPGRRPPRPLSGDRLLREGARRDAGDRRARGRLRAAHEPDPTRARGVPSQTPMRGVRATPDVPLVPCPPEMSAERGNR